MQNLPLKRSVMISDYVISLTNLYSRLQTEADNIRNVDRRTANLIE